MGSWLCKRTPTANLIGHIDVALQTVFTTKMADTPTSLTLLGGRYRHLREIGQGGSGRVVMVRDEVDGTPLAVKMVTAAARDRLAWEFELLRRVAHPNLASVRELLVFHEPVGVPFHLAPGSAVLVEDFVEGVPAHRALAGIRGHRRWVAALRIVDDVCAALAAIHDEGLLHGDIKPDNVLVRPDGGAVLVDLGLAGPPLAADGRVRGTPAYLAPEAWTGARSIGTDLFALGATLAGLLTSDLGERPTGSTTSPTLFVELPADIPLELRELVEALRAADPRDRPHDARDALGRIRELRRRLGETLPPEPLPDASPAAQALRAGSVPHVADAALVARLVEALRAGGVVRVGGPDGAGRSRLIQEAVARLQREAANMGCRVPTYVVAAGAIAPPDDACVLHLPAPVEEEWLERELRAAAVAGRALSVVIEGRERGDVNVEPLDDAALDTLLERLVGHSDEALRRAARRVSGGLAGRLCRAVADAFAAGQDPSRSEVLARASSTGEVHEERTEAMARLALAGGSLPVNELALTADEARHLISRGTAWVEEGRWILRRDLVEPLREGATPFETNDSRARAYLAAAAEEQAEASAAFAALIDEALEAGDLAEAGRLAEDGSRLLGTPELALRHAETLRTAGRYDEALAALEGRSGPTIAAARAEIARRAGRRALAEEALEEAGDLGAVTRAWLHVSDVTGPAPTFELRSWKALLAGDLEAAEAHARNGLAEVRGERRHERQARARLRATLGAVLQAQGDAANAAQQHRRAIDLARSLGERHLAATALANLGAVQLDAGILGEGRKALIEAGRELLRLGRDRDAARTLANLASVSLWIGDEVAADRVREQAEAAAVRAEDEEALAIAWLLRLELALRGGDIATTSALVERAPTSASATTALVRTRAAGLLAPHDPTRAADLLDPAAPPFERWLAQARLALARRTPVPRIDPPVPPDTWERRLLLALAQGDIAAATGDTAGSERAGAWARQLLDEAADTLTPAQRRRLRRVPAHQRVLSHRPAQEATGRTERWRQLAARAKRLTPERALSWLREEVVEAAVELVDAERGFWIERTERGHLAIRTGRALDDDVAISRSVVARTLDGRRPVWAVDALQDERLQAAGSVHALALRSVLCVPIRWHGREAALYVDDRSRPAAFGEEDGALLADLAELAAIAFHGAERLRAERAAVEQLEEARRQLLQEVESQRAQLAALRATAPDLIAASPAMRRIMDLIARVAPADVPVLILGESGSGKDRIAGAIHAMSNRRHGPFVAENCGAIADTLLESALFGHERGAFTGANTTRRGLFELADGGTLFLDEIGEMSPSMQAKLLRVVQEGELRRVGSERTRQVDVRIVAATHRNLEAMIAAGTFREDLYYRLAVVKVEVPPLRERAEDLPGLVQAILDEHARHQGHRASITEAALEALARAPWPGNVRQLDNVLQRALLLTDGAIDVTHLDLHRAGDTAPPLNLKARLDALERELVTEAMRRCGQNQTQAAKLLGVSRYGLQKKLKRLRIS